MPIIFYVSLAFFFFLAMVSLSLMVKLVQVDKAIGRGIQANSPTKLQTMVVNTSITKTNKDPTRFSRLQRP